MLLSASTSLLLIVDIQERLAPAIHDGMAVAARAATLVQAARAFDVPVLATEQYPRGLGRTIPAVADHLAPDETVEKIHFSASEEPEVLRRIEHCARRQILVCGMEAHVCVLQTALGLRVRGYDVFVAADAAGSRDPANAALGYDRMRAAGVGIVGTEMVLFEWLYRAGTPVFKAVLPLIR
jgi:nicotinamidase-related amidase